MRDVTLVILNSLRIKCHIRRPLTNTPRRLTTVLNVPLGIRDFHNFICVATRMCKPTKAIRQITYRSYTRFNDMAYK